MFISNSSKQQSKTQRKAIRGLLTEQLADGRLNRKATKNVAGQYFPTESTLSVKWYLESKIVKNQNCVENACGGVKKSSVLLSHVTSGH